MGSSLRPSITTSTNKHDSLKLVQFIGAHSSLNGSRWLKCLHNIVYVNLCCSRTRLSMYNYYVCENARQQMFSRVGKYVGSNDSCNVVVVVIVIIGAVEYHVKVISRLNASCRLSLCWAFIPYACRLMRPWLYVCVGVCVSCVSIFTWARFHMHQFIIIIIIFIWVLFGSLYGWAVPFITCVLFVCICFVVPLRHIYCSIHYTNSSASEYEAGINGKACRVF